MKKLLIIPLFLSISIITTAQTISQQWATEYAGTGENSDKFNAMIIDGAGNVYAAGYTWKQGNGKDFLIIKFNSSGDTLWTRSFDGSGNGNDEATDLAFDNTGNIIAIGSTKTKTGKDLATYKLDVSGNMLWMMTYNNGASLDDYGVKVVCDASGNIYTGGYGYNSNLNNDYLIIKYSSAGVQLNTVSFDGADQLDDVLNDMAIDASGNILVTGKSRTAANKDDYATVKYNSSLVAQWSKTLDQAGKTDRATGIFVDGSGNVYVTGRSSNGSDDDFVTVKYNAANGTQAWIKTYDSGGDDQAEDIAGNGTSIVICGTKFNGIQNDLQTISYSLSGTLQWSTTYAGGAGLDENVNHVTIDAAGNSIITGTTQIAATPSNDNILVIRYNNSGSQQWANVLGGTMNIDDNSALSLIENTSGNVYTVGALTNSNTMKDACLLNHNAAGTLQYNKQYNGEGEFTDKGIAICMSGGILYSTGYCYSYNEDRNFCTIKYDASGNKVWVKTYNGPGFDTDEPRAIAGDVSGNIYVAGRSKNLLNDYDLLIVKYNPAGDTLWTRNYDSGILGDEDAVSMAVNSNGDVYVTGVADGDASLLVNNNYLTAKFSAAGGLLWAKTYNGTGNGDDKAISIDLDNAGNAYVTGKTWNGLDYDIQTMKYASTNGLATPFATYSSTIGDDIPSVLKLDYNGNICIGATSDRDATSSTNRDFLTIQYNSAGVQQWANLYNGSGTGDDDLSNLTIDANGNIIVTGSSDLDSTATDNLDYVTIKYSNSGTEAWRKTYDGNAHNTDIATSVSTDINGNIFVVGQSDEGSGLSKNNDCTTLVYSATGNELQHVSFDGAATGTDQAAHVLNDGGLVYITGYGTFSTSQQKDFLTLQYNVSTGIKSSVDEETQWIVFPNPTNQYLNIKSFSKEIFNQTNLSAVDVTGKTVLQQELSSNSVYNRVDVSGLAKGLYLFRLTTGNQAIYSTRIVIQ